MFITDTRPGEPPVLNGNLAQPLVFKTLDGEIAAVVQTDRPWTHEQLTAVDLDSVLGANYTSQGFDAYVGNTWVGSTEV
ncbi:hypothetical protein EGT81_19260 [Alcaligenes faecalis]|uniref:hypothetical protein n=1 Tax=Alcaligenes faecalis TaxID=511 RepID=UPI000F65BA72|nr:hypothetical protein [Alcaligenes faecalis]RSE57578.1 hypothetical protein EGT81_19260 [Alcaligenes faecalis]